MCLCNVFMLPIDDNIQFHWFECWWPVLDFIRICVYSHSLLHLCTLLYTPYACIFVYICNNVCMCIIRYLTNCVKFFPYSKCQKCPITQEKNCTTESSISIRKQKTVWMSKNDMSNITWNRKKYIPLGSGGIMPSYR